MPARKRTSQPRRTSPTSPTTSTSHAAADQHHHLRHTGPSISTRTSVSAAPSKLPPALSETNPTLESSTTHQGPREKKSLAETSAPGAHTSFAKFIYILFFFLSLTFLGWYAYGTVTLPERLREEVGQWGIVVGDYGGTARWESVKERVFGPDRADGSGGGQGGDLDGSLNALADALGVSPVQVASAVKPLIPRESLTRIALKEAGDSKAVRILLEDTARDGSGKESVISTGIAEEFAGESGRGSDKEEAADGGVV